MIAPRTNIIADQYVYVDMLELYVSGQLIGTTTGHPSRISGDRLNGQGIRVALHSGNSARYDTEDVSGTSFAAPAFAAVMAHFVGWEALRGPGAGLRARNRLIDNSQHGILADSWIDWAVWTSVPTGTPNRLANTGIFNPRKALDVPYFWSPGQASTPMLKR
jgi:hypothetical protein